MPDKEALKQLIASLPNPENDPDDDPQLQGMGPEEITYLEGLRDALQVLNGQPVQNPNMLNAIRRHVRRVAAREHG